MKSKNVQFELRMSGYDHDDTKVVVSRKYQGTAPDITVRLSGKYNGEICLSLKATRELIESLEYILK